MMVVKTLFGGSMFAVFYRETVPRAEAGPDQRLSHVIQAFVKHIYESDPECSKYLDAIVKGHMLANALILPDLGSIRRRFRRTSVYCDTPLMLRALGYEGHARQAPCAELLELLKEVGAAICCFKDTRNEVYDILYACEMALAQSSTRIPYGSVFYHFSQSGSSPADLELEMARLDKNIERLGIRIMEKPEYVKKYQVDESRLENTLDTLVGYLPDRLEARKHDVDCLSAVFRLRKGQSYYNVEECYALFVTPNSSLCRVNADFFVKDQYIGEGSVPIVVTDYALTNIIWLKKPMIAPNLPRKYVIAECYAAMEPGERLWRKYLHKINQLRDRGDISEDEYYLLRETQLARTQLTEITMGNEEALVEGTPQEILARICQSIRETDLRELALEKERHLREVTLERERREEAERQLRFEQDRAREREETLKFNIQKKSRTVALLISVVLFGMLEVLVLVGAVYEVIQGLARSEPTWLHWTFSALAILFVLLSVYSLFTGTMAGWLRHFQSWLSSYIERLLTSLLMSPKQQ